MSFSTSPTSFNGSHIVYNKHNQKISETKTTRNENISELTDVNSLLQRVDSIARRDKNGNAIDILPSLNPFGGKPAIKVKVSKDGDQLEIQKNQQFTIRPRDWALKMGLFIDKITKKPFENEERHVYQINKSDGKDEAEMIQEIADVIKVRTSFL